MIIVGHSIVAKVLDPKAREHRGHQLLDNLSQNCETFQGQHCGNKLESVKDALVRNSAHRFLGIYIARHLKPQIVAEKLEFKTKVRPCQEPVNDLIGGDDTFKGILLLKLRLEILKENTKQFLTVWP